MIEDKYYLLDKNQTIKSDFWTNQLYNKAYDKVKDRLWPIVVPSYNRPNNKFYNNLIDNMKSGFEYPIYFIVRKSQEEQYNNNTKYFKYMHVISFEDSLIDNIGKVREQIVNYFNGSIFMLDDDCYHFSYTVPFTRPSGTRVGYSNKVDNLGKYFAMWQLATEYVYKLYPNLIFSSCMNGSFSWVEDRCDPAYSGRMLAGGHKLAVSVNIDNLKKNNLNYRTIINNGHDDVDLLIRALLKGLPVVEYRWLTLNSTPIGTDILNFKSVEDRFDTQYKEMYNNFKDVDFVKFDNKSKLKNVSINWIRCMKYFNKNNYGDFTNNREFDIWRNGKILEDNYGIE